MKCMLKSHQINEAIKFLFTIILGVYGIALQPIRNLPSISRTIILEVSLVLNYFLGRMKIEKVLVNFQFCYFTRKTETFDSCRIEFATLPRTFPLKPPIPFEPITTRSTFPF